MPDAKNIHTLRSRGERTSCLKISAPSTAICPRYGSVKTRGTERPFDPRLIPDRLAAFLRATKRSRPSLRLGVLYRAAAAVLDDDISRSGIICLESETESDDDDDDSDSESDAGAGALDATADGDARPGPPGPHAPLRAALSVETKQFETR